MSQHECGGQRTYSVFHPYVGSKSRTHVAKLQFQDSQNSIVRDPVPKQTKTDRLPKGPRKMVLWVKVLACGKPDNGILIKYLLSPAFLLL